MRLAPLLRLAPFLLLILSVRPAAAQCAVGDDQKDLDINDVRARMYNIGTLFWRGATPIYIVPQTGDAAPVFAAGIWVGGRVNDQLRTSAARYDNYAFAPGPLNAPAGTPPNPTNCEPYDRIYKVSRFDVLEYEAGLGARADLRDWPVGLGAPTVNAAGQPVTSTDRTRIINLAAGERPVLGGDQAVFWVMNDYTPRTGTESAPLGIEVQVLAFARATANPIYDQATFYRYTVVNRTGTPIEDARVGFFFDADLGDYSDDYVGTDPARSLLYTYNADNDDTGAGSYGENPPAVGIDLLRGADVMAYFVNSANTATSDPTTPAEYYRTLSGLWRDGSPYREGGTGYGGSGAVVEQVFTGDPVVPTFWSENYTTGTGGTNTPDDRRGVVVAPMTTLEPNEPRVFDFAIVFARGANHLASVTALRAASDSVQVAYDAGALFPAVGSGTTANETAPGATAALGLALAPNPAAGEARASFTLPASAAVRLRAFDVLGREVAVLHEGTHPAGAHRVAFSTRVLPRGTYLLVLDAGAAWAVGRLAVGG